MENYMVRGTDKGKHFRFFAANTTQLVNEATQAHGTSPVVSAALGRTLTCTAMMGAMLKSDKERVGVSLRGDGPMRGIIAESDAHGNVKGYPYVAVVDMPTNAQGKLDVSGAIGMGDLTVIKDIGMKEP